MGMEENPRRREMLKGLSDRSKQVKKEAEVFSMFKPDWQGEWYYCY